MKILSNEALELSYDATEEIEEISKEGDELEDELDVAGDIVIEAEEARGLSYAQLREWLAAKIEGKEFRET